MSINQAIFKSYDIRGKVGTDLNEDTTREIAMAFADFLPVKGTVAVGRDMRPDSEALSKAFIDGLVSQGYDVWDIGQVTSDMIYFAIGKWDLAGGAVITASHNAGDENGIKLYRDKVTPVGLDSGLSEIRDNVLSETFSPAAAKPGSVAPKTITDEWIEHCLSFISEIKPFDIAIDTGNGMAGAVLPHILPKLPLTVDKMFFEVDGTFPNHEANPQVIENLQPLIERVLAKQYDFGIAFDGDGDRAVFIDDKGRLVLGTDLMTIVARLYLQKYPGSTIVHDVRTSRATVEIIKELGGTPVRTKAGRVNVGAKLRELGGSFGGETTGHFFYKENYEADSGLIVALTAMQALSDSGKRLSELVDEVRRYEMIPEKNMHVTDKTGALEKIAQEFGDGQQDTLDGLTVNYPTYWFNLRASNTEDVMRLNAEAGDQAELDKLVSKIVEIVSSF